MILINDLLNGPQDSLADKSSLCFASALQIAIWARVLARAADSMSKATADSTLPACLRADICSHSWTFLYLVAS